MTNRLPDSGHDRVIGISQPINTTYPKYRCPAEFNSTLLQRDMSEHSPSCKSTLSSAAFHSTKAAYAHPSVRQQSKRSLNRCPEACGVRKLCQDTLSSVGVGTRSVTKPVYHTSSSSSSSSIDCRDHRLRDSNHDPRGEEQEEEELEMEKNEIKTILHDNHIGETESERERETRRDETRP